MGTSDGQLALSLDHKDQRRRFAPAYLLLQEAVAERVFPGCAFGVLAAGKVVALDAVGLQTYAEDSPPIAHATVYDLASVTKVAATTAMAMLLHQRGALELDCPLAGLLPAFAEGPESAARSRVTLRHLLAHASGLPGYARLFEIARTPEAMLDACLHLPLAYPPGTHAEYSDIGFILLGKALEALAGETIDTFCAREVFAPCGMESTGFRPCPERRAAIPPTEEDRTFRHSIIQGVVQDENCWVLGGVSGHAGLFGNALDLLRFAAAVLRSSPRFGQPGGLFSAETLRLFATRAELPAGSSRALGWDTPSASSDSGTSSAGTMFGPRSIGHLGFAGTSLWIDLDAQVAAVLLSNRTWPLRQSQAIRVLRPRWHDAVRQALLLS